MNRFALVLTATVVSSFLIGTGLIIVATSLRPARLTPSAVANPTPPPPVAPVPVTAAVPTPTPSLAGKAEVNLGRRPWAYGSAAQARDLLSAMDQQPGRAAYTVAYETEVDAVAFGCDLPSGLLLRVHQEPNDHGTKEVWRGYVIERLRNAAAGGFLNDTPAGKSLVDFQKF